MKGWGLVVVGMGLVACGPAIEVPSETEGARAPRRLQHVTRRRHASWWALAHWVAPSDAAGLTELALGYEREWTCGDGGNCEGERADARLDDGSAATIIDVYLRCG